MTRVRSVPVQSAHRLEDGRRRACPCARPRRVMSRCPGPSRRCAPANHPRRGMRAAPTAPRRSARNMREADERVPCTQTSTRSSGVPSDRYHEIAVPAPDCDEGRSHVLDHRRRRRSSSVAQRVAGCVQELARRAPPRGRAARRVTARTKPARRASVSTPQQPPAQLVRMRSARSPPSSCDSNGTETKASGTCSATANFGACRRFPGGCGAFVAAAPTHGSVAAAAAMRISSRRERRSMRVYRARSAARRSR
jgi:hypothetical protein